MISDVEGYLREERSRLLVAAAERVARARQSVGTLFILLVLLNGLGLLAAPPNARVIFGGLSVTQGLWCVAPANMSAVIAFLLYRRLGAGSPAYQAAFTVELLAICGVPIAMCYLSGLTRTLLWGILPYSAMSVAMSAPSLVRRHGLALGAAYVGLAGMSVAKGRSDLALTACVVGTVSLAAFIVVARRELLNVEVEAQRNVLRLQLDDAELLRQRERVAALVRTHLGEKFVASANELRDGASADVHAVFRELESIVRPTAQEHTLATLAEAIDDKCRSLPSHYERTPIADGALALALAPATALTLLRIAQELVRNAVTHGQAEHVALDLRHEGGLVTLRVRDDGQGLDEGAFAGAAGGLANAREWLLDARGTLAYVPTSVGAELVATVPVERRRPAIASRDVV